MSNIASLLREIYPEYDSYTDDQINSVFAPGGPTISNQNEEAPSDRGFGSDVLAAWGIGSNTLLKGVGRLYGWATDDMDNWATRQGQSGIDYYNREFKSENMENLEAQRAAEIAKADGFWSEMGTAVWETVKNPELLAYTIVESLPAYAVGGGAGKVAGLAGTAAGASATTAGRVALGTSIGTTGSLQGASVGDQAYEDLMKMPLELWETNTDFVDLTNSGVGADEAKRTLSEQYSQSAMQAATALSIATQAIPGATSIDRTLAGQGSRLAGSLPARMGKGFIGEGLQEATEEGGGQVFGNQAKMKVDPYTKLMDDVGSTAGIAFTAGGPMGAVSGIQAPDPGIAQARAAEKARIEALDQQVARIEATTPGDSLSKQVAGATAESANAAERLQAQDRLYEIDSMEQTLQAEIDAAGEEFRATQLATIRMDAQRRAEEAQAAETDNLSELVQEGKETVRQERVASIKDRQETNQSDEGIDMEAVRKAITTPVSKRTTVDIAVLQAYQNARNGRIPYENTTLLQPETVSLMQPEGFEETKKAANEVDINAEPVEASTEQKTILDQAIDSIQAQRAAATERQTTHTGKITQDIMKRAEELASKQGTNLDVQSMWEQASDGAIRITEAEQQEPESPDDAVQRILSEKIAENNQESSNFQAPNVTEAISNIEKMVGKRKGQKAYLDRAARALGIPKTKKGEKIEQRKVRIRQVISGVKKIQENAEALMRGDFTVKEMKDMATKAGIKVASRLNKQQIAVEMVDHLSKLEYSNQEGKRKTAIQRVIQDKVKKKEAVPLEQTDELVGRYNVGDGSVFTPGDIDTAKWLGHDFVYPPGERPNEAAFEQAVEYKKGAMQFVAKQGKSDDVSYRKFFTAATKQTNPDINTRAQSTELVEAFEEMDLGVAPSTANVRSLLNDVYQTTEYKAFVEQAKEKSDKRFKDFKGLPDSAKITYEWDKESLDKVEFVSYVPSKRTWAAMAETDIISEKELKDAEEKGRTPTSLRQRMGTGKSVIVKLKPEYSGSGQEGILIEANSPQQALAIVKKAERAAPGGRNPEAYSFMEPEFAERLANNQVSQEEILEYYNSEETRSPEVLEEYAAKQKEARELADLNMAADLEAKRSAAAVGRYNAPVKDTDTALDVLAKIGGWNREEAEAQFVDPASFNMRAAGIKNVFPKTGGKSLDAIAESFAEVGLVKDDPNTRHAETLEILTRSINGGEKIRTPTGEAIYQEQLLKAQEKMAQPIEAADETGEATNDEEWLAVLVARAENAGVPRETIDDILNQQDAYEASIDITGAINEYIQKGGSSQSGGQADSNQEFQSLLDDDDPFSGSVEVGPEEIWGEDWDGPTDELLTTYSEQELADKAAADKLAQAERAARDYIAEQKAQADRDAQNFDLTGSDLPADQNANQGDLLSQPAPKPANKLEAFKAALIRDGFPTDVEILPGKSETNASDFAEKVAKAFKQKIQWVTIEGDHLYGAVFDGDLFLNTLSDAPYHIVLGHELVHKLRQEMPDLYQDLYKLIIPNATNTRKSAKLHSMQPGSDSANEEYIADVVGNQFANKQFWQDMAAEQPNLFKRVAKLAQEMLTRLANMFRHKKIPFADEVNAINALRLDIAKIMSKFANNRLPEADRNNPISTKYAPAYHGTPHTVDGKFDLDKVGTGEGAAAYGWGMYFAGNREVAEHYAKTLSSGVILENISIGDLVVMQDEVAGDYGPGNWGGEAGANLVENLLINEYEMKQIYEAEGNEGVEDYIKQQILDARTSYEEQLEDYPEYAKEQLALLDEIEKQQVNVSARIESGNIYKVDIPERNELLSWDDPLDTQGSVIDLDSIQVALDETGRIDEIVDLLQESEPFGVDTEEMVMKALVTHDQDVWTNLTDFDNPEAVQQLQELKSDIGLDLEINYDTGETLYRHLEAMLGSDQAASEFLFEQGIKGLKYLDGMSRGDSEQKQFNFVIWDEDAISIDEINDQPNIKYSRAINEEDVNEQGTTGAGTGTGSESGSENGNANSGADGTESPAGATGSNESAPREAQNGSGSDRGDSGNNARGGDTTERADSPLKASIKDRFTAFRYYMQDKLIDLRNEQEGKELTDEANPYQKAAIWEGKAGEELNDFDEAQVEPLLREIANTGLEWDEVGEWLVARHAEEANAYLAEINPDKPDEERYRLAGMSNDEAQEILNRHRDNTALQQVGDIINEINTARVAMLVESGLITQDEADAWQGAYENYVPLKRLEATQSDMLPSRGQGFQLRGKESKGRTGSAYWTPGNIVANVISQYESTVVRKHKNDVAQSLLKFVEQNPNSDLYVVERDRKMTATRPVAKRDADGNVMKDENGKTIFTRKVVKVPNTNVAQHEMVVRQRDGKEAVIVFNRQDPRAMRMVSGLKNLQAAEMNTVMRGMATFTRFLSNINTSYNPEFLISNFTRDIQTAAYNLSDTELKNAELSTLKNVPAAMKGIRSALRGDGSGEWAAIFEDFRRSGGKTGWIDLHRDILKRDSDLEKMSKRLGQGKPSKNQLQQIGKFVEDYNMIFENAARLSAYKAALDAGLSKDRAAALAKDLTVNFNRKGAAGQQINALYMFYNASIQGSVRLLQAMKSPKGRKLVAATVAFAAALDAMNRATAPDDDDGENLYDALPDYVKNHNLIVWGGSDRREPLIKIPLPWGYNVFHTIGQSVGEALTSDRFDAGNAAMRIGTSIMEAFNPVGSATLLQTLAPTIIDPYVMVQENTTFAGTPLMPEHSYDIKAPKPEYQMHWSSAREPSKAITKWLNDATNGNSIRPGWINVSPEILDLVWDTATGGAGRFAGNSLDVIYNLYTGEEQSSGNIPFVRKVTGYDPENGVKMRYYDWTQTMAYTKSEIKNLRGKERLEAMRRPEAKLVGAYDQAEKSLRQLRKVRKQAEAAGDTDRVKRIDARIRGVMQRFNARYAKVMFE